MAFWWWRVAKSVICVCVCVCVDLVVICVVIAHFASHIRFCFQTIILDFVQCEAHLNLLNVLKTTKLIEFLFGHVHALVLVLMRGR